MMTRRFIKTFFFSFFISIFGYTHNDNDVTTANKIEQGDYELDDDLFGI